MHNSYAVRRFSNAASLADALWKDHVMKFDRTSLVVGGMIGALLTIVASGTVLGARPAEAQPDVFAAVQRTQAMAVIHQLDTAGLHDLDVALTGGQVPSGALGVVRRGRIAAQATSWPHELEADAAAMAQGMERLEAGLRDEDAAKAQPAAKEVHDLEHDLSDKVYAWLSGAAPPA